MKGSCVKIIQFNKYFRYMQITEIGVAEGTLRGEEASASKSLKLSEEMRSEWSAPETGVLAATAPSKPGRGEAQDCRRWGEEGLQIAEDPTRTNPLFNQHLWCHYVNIH